MSDEKARLPVRISVAVKERVVAEPDDPKTTMRAVVEAAIGAYLNPHSYINVSLERRARLDRNYTAVLKRSDVLIEFMLLITRAWFPCDPTPDDTESREALDRQGDARFEDSIAEADNFTRPTDSPNRRPLQTPLRRPLPPAPAAARGRVRSEN